MQAIGSNADYKLVHELLLRGADLTLKTSNGEMLADDIATRAINPSSNQFLWREKVMEYLRSKGVTVVRPAREALQTKP